MGHELGDHRSASVNFQIVCKTVEINTFITFLNVITNGYYLTFQMLYF